ncbi:hypothetical protein ACIBRY_02470 [Streptomyces anulatus]
MDTRTLARRFLEESADDDVTLRFQQGPIAESWFNYDLAGALEQVGAPPAADL